MQCADKRKVFHPGLNSDHCPHCSSPPGLASYLAARCAERGLLASLSSPCPVFTSVGIDVCKVNCENCSGNTESCLASSARFELTTPGSGDTSIVLTLTTIAPYDAPLSDEPVS